MSKLVKAAQAGTIESSDIMITVAPLETGSGRIIELTSPVRKQYGRSIEQAIVGMLDIFQIDDVQVVANDRGALDCTIKARMETALARAMELEGRA